MNAPVNEGLRQLELYKNGQTRNIGQPMAADRAARLLASIRGWDTDLAPEVMRNMRNLRTPYTIEVAGGGYLIAQPA